MLPRVADRAAPAAGEVLLRRRSRRRRGERGRRGRFRAGPGGARGRAGRAAASAQIDRARRRRAADACVHGEAADGMRTGRSASATSSILLRSMRYKADQFADVLRLCGRPGPRESGTGYFESVEVRDMLALLALLDNQRQDIPLAAVLRSPLAGLAGAGRRAGARPAGVLGAPSGRCRSTRRSSATPPSRTTSWRRSLRDFLTRPDRVAANWPTAGRWRRRSASDLRADRLPRLRRRPARRRAARGQPAVPARAGRAVRHVPAAGALAVPGVPRATLRAESDLGQPSVATEAEDVVRVMSIHRSKGLEFPVVVLPDLGKLINLQDCQGSDPAGPRGRAGHGRGGRAKKRIRYPSLASTLVQERLRRQAMAEELRVLYVAMTRAKEHLILVGTCGEEADEKWRGRWSDHRGSLPADAVLGRDLHARLARPRGRLRRPARAARSSASPATARPRWRGGTPRQRRARRTRRAAGKAGAPGTAGPAPAAAPGRRRGRAAVDVRLPVRGVCTPSRGAVGDVGGKRGGETARAAGGERDGHCRFTRDAAVHGGPRPALGRGSRVGHAPGLTAPGFLAPAGRRGRGGPGGGTRQAAIDRAGPRGARSTATPSRGSFRPKPGRCSARTPPAFTASFPCTTRPRRRSTAQMRRPTRRHRRRPRRARLGDGPRPA